MRYHEIVLAKTHKNMKQNLFRKLQNTRTSTQTNNFFRFFRVIYDMPAKANFLDIVGVVFKGQCQMASYRRAASKRLNDVRSASFSDFDAAQ